jgi:hypothetical protein
MRLNCTTNIKLLVNTATRDGRKFGHVHKKQDKKEWREYGGKVRPIETIYRKTNEQTIHLQSRDAEKYK